MRVKRTYTLQTVVSFNIHLFHVRRRSAVYPIPHTSFGHVWLHLGVLDTLSHCRQYGRHRQYAYQRQI